MGWNIFRKNAWRGSVLPSDLVPISALKEVNPDVVTKAFTDRRTIYSDDVRIEINNKYHDCIAVSSVFPHAYQESTQISLFEEFPLFASEAEDLAIHAIMLAGFKTMSQDIPIWSKLKQKSDNL